ncbi:hypothetical protein GQ44DRAFT_822150 [Phaeosphaeriaceae sp. PMI808]|nr:hypothetical protein GQ44DRAFT_822150 [Phaeosphaeriaceae sp. PMI808]
MLRFHQDEPPNSTKIELVDFEHLKNSTSETNQSQELDPLPQHEAYAFIPYRPSNDPTNTTTTDTLTLNNTSTWTYCGPLLAPNATDLPQSFHTWNAITLSHPSILLSRLLPLLSFLKTFLANAGAHHYWLTLRATKPTPEYNTPRWHVDEKFFSPAPEDPLLTSPNDHHAPRYWKLTTVLLGPQTLFQQDNTKALHIVRDTSSQHRTTHQCTSLRCPVCAAHTDTIRASLARSLSPYPSTSPAPHDLAFLRLGSSEGAVHSEPRCDVDRVFVNIVPGTEEGLRRLLARWGMEYPRAWCFGVPVAFEGVGVGKGCMSVNVAEEYGEWLGGIGVSLKEVFGKGGRE